MYCSPRYLKFTGIKYSAVSLSASIMLLASVFFDFFFSPPARPEELDYKGCRASRRRRQEV
jgi:hypothetical protein